MIRISPVGISSPAPDIDETPLTKEDLKTHVSTSKPRIELLLIQENADLKKLSDDFMKSVLNHLKRENHALSASLQEQLTHLTQQAEGMSNGKSWNLLSTLAHATLLALGLGASIQLGNTTLAMAAAVRLAQNLVTYCNGWDWIAETLASENETAKSAIRTFIPLAMTALSLHLGANGFQLAGDTAGELLQPLQYLNTCVSGTLHIGQAYNSYKQGNLDAQVIESEAEIKMHDKKVTALSRELKHWLEISRELSSLSKQSVKQMIRVTNAAALGV